MKYGPCAWLTLLALALWVAVGCGSSAEENAGAPATTEADAGVVVGADASSTADVNASDDAALASLALSTGTLWPAFDPAMTTYTATTAFFDANVAITAVPRAPGATMTLLGNPLAAGVASQPIVLPTGLAMVLSLEVTAPDGETKRTYTIAATRATLAQQAYAKASNTDLGDQFGYSIALSGDTLAVGAPYESSAMSGIDPPQLDNNKTRAGAVYVFKRTALGWSQQAYIKASNPDANDLFGWSVALEGDTLVVGARGEASAATGINNNQGDNSVPGAGAVYVYTRTAGVWAQQAYIKASNTDGNDQFGFSVALSGDTLAVGANQESSKSTGINQDQADDSSTQTGAVYVFARTAGIWSQQAYVKASNAEAWDNFGFSVALDGDSLAVGALNEASAAKGINGSQSDNGAGYSGAVYVFTRAAGVWSQQAYVKASNTDPNDHFGYSVSLRGDTLAVGAVGESSAATAINGDQADNSSLVPGAAYVFTRTAGVWSQQAYVKPSTSPYNGQFGGSVAVSGDTLVVGALYESSAAEGIDGDATDRSKLGAGAAYVFVRTAGAWAQQAYVKATNPDKDDHFGLSLALDGSTLAVGSPCEGSAATGLNGAQADNTKGCSGAAYVLR